MKTLMHAVAVLVLLPLFTMAQYSEKSGRIAYKIEMGSTQMSYSILYDQYGAQQLLNVNSKEHGIEEKVSTIITSEFIYIVNYDDRLVIKFPSSMGDEAMEQSTVGFSVDQLATEVASYQTAKSGTETLLGHPCDIFTINEAGNKGKYWIWKDYILKAEFMNEAGQHNYMEATQLDLNIQVPAGSFAPPEGYTMHDMSQMMEMQEMFGMPDMD